MEAFQKALDSQNQIFYGYMAAMLIGCLAFAFVAVCAGVWLLRNSKRNEQKQNYRPENFQSSHDRPESSPSTAVSKPATSPPLPLVEKGRIFSVPREDLKYLPRKIQ
jgi:hypothetical protein